MAKLIIKLINDVAAVVNADPDVAGRLNVVFLPNFNVTLGERIYPAADLSEQISLAGKEASGTGNMKLALNGAVTIGTLDGANIEIRDLVGEDNFFLFGLTAEEVMAKQAAGYRPADYADASPPLREALYQIASGHFSGGNGDLYQPLVHELVTRDPYMLLADFDAYVAAQDEAERAYQDTDRWVRMSIMNAARCGYFSSDRSVREYCDQIWKVQPIEIGDWTEDQVGPSQPLGQPMPGAVVDLPDLNEQEREQLCELPLLVGLDVLHTSDSGAHGTMLELATAVAAPTATARFLTRSALVRSLAGTEDEMIERSERLIRQILRDYALRTEDGRARLHADVLRQCRAAFDLLSARAQPGVAAEYVRWLLLVGERVAQAAEEACPGQPERQVSEAEAAALREIATALHIEP
jgi:hypothetical protein